MKKMNKLKRTRNNIVKWTLIASVIILFISLFIFEDKKAIIFGIIFGTSISILNFIELEKSLIKSSQMNSRQAQSYATRKYFLRYIITAIVILISIKASYINVIGTIIGLLLLKFVIMFTNLFNDKKYFKRIFRREG